MMEVKDLKWKLVLKTTVTSITSAAGDNSEIITINKWSKNIHLHLMEELQHKAERKCPRKEVA